MTSRERVITVLKGGKPDRVPVCIINFISVCNDAGLSVRECFLDPKKFSYAHIKAQQKYGHDMVHLQNGVVGLAQSFGCTVEYYDTVCPEVIERPYGSYKEFIDSYHGFTPGELLQSLIKTTELIVTEIGDDVFIRGDNEIGPIGLAGTIFGFETFLMDLLDDTQTEEINRVLEICCDAIIELGREQHRAGAHLTGFGDPFAGPDVISPRLYKTKCFPYHKYIVTTLKESGIPSYLHCCGDATGIIDDLVATGIIAVELDYKIDGMKCLDATSGRCTLIGTIDPSGVMCHGTPELVLEKCREAIELYSEDGWYILGTGCDLPYETPPENISALVEAAKRYGSYL
jgi:MtaA/CmuA family methyltransferase